MDREKEAAADASLPDTIIARATAAGDGAVAILRLSGPLALATVSRLFRKKTGKPRKTWQSHRVIQGWMVDPIRERKIDEVLVLYMERGRSFTGEELVEIHCHGGAAVVRSLTALLLREGLRPALPGEFTRRAFLNGRMSLDEAEAVNDLVRARSEEAALITVDNLSGALKSQITRLRQGVIALLALLEANVDFPEDDIDAAHTERVTREVEVLAASIEQLARSYERGRILREGIRVVLAGKPNVGKSSLMNAMLRCERSIVTDVPGTTRDTIEEGLSYRGLSYVLIDTAGLRETVDMVERIGVERTHLEVARAGLTLFLVDAVQSPNPEEREFLEELRTRESSYLLVVNKIDLSGPGWHWRTELPWIKTLEVSALTGLGTEELLEAVHELASTQLVPSAAGPVVSSERHRDCLLRAGDALASFRRGIVEEMPIDVCLVDLYETANQLGLITGQIVTEDILDAIFSKFCIGK